ncbi:MAG: response regulator FixJ [Alphaproteobacteria bacterium]|nr:response regulator FixJ [Alphaproteobacteria bacterium]
MSPDWIVHIVDDDDAIRDSLAFMLESSGHRVRAYPSADHFLEQTDAPEHGWIVTDVRMPGKSGLDLLRTLRARGLTLPVILMTGHGDVPLAVEAMKAGAIDFLEKPFDAGRLLAALKTSRESLTLGDERAAEKVETARRIATLSGREMDVLEGLFAGHANKAIAFDLGISARTVEIYRANVMTKMKASSLSELVRMVVVSRT